MNFVLNIHVLWKRETVFVHREGKSFTRFCNECITLKTKFLKQK